jgi:hypothetical protein
VFVLIEKYTIDLNIENQPVLVVTANISLDTDYLLKMLVVELFLNKIHRDIYVMIDVHFEHEIYMVHHRSDVHKRGDISNVLFVQR